MHIKQLIEDDPARNMQGEGLSRPSWEVCPCLGDHSDCTMALGLVLCTSLWAFEGLD